jgi:hypothetical protein
MQLIVLISFYFLHHKIIIYKRKTFRLLQKNEITINNENKPPQNMDYIEIIAIVCFN